MPSFVLGHDRGRLGGGAGVGKGGGRCRRSWVGAGGGTGAIKNMAEIPRQKLVVHGCLRGPGRVSVGRGAGTVRCELSVADPTHGIMGGWSHVS
jgi:hypothetical protein